MEAKILELLQAIVDDKQTMEERARILNELSLEWLKVKATLNNNER